MERPKPEPMALNELPPRILHEVNLQFRAARNDILRYAVWNLRNLSDEEFNHTDDVRLLGYFRTDLLETRFITKGRRVDVVQLWHWFDDQTSGTQPLLMGDEEVFLNIQDKDLEKVRKRIEEIKSFLPILRGDDLEAFKRVKFKLRRTVLRLTYDLHHLTKKFDKYRKQGGVRPHAEIAAHDPIHPPAEAIAEPEPAEV